MNLITTTALSTASFLGGLLIGNWLAIAKDKRLEFNAIADIACEKLHKQLLDLDKGRCFHVLGDNETRALQWRVFGTRRLSFSKAIREYQIHAGHDSCDNDGFGRYFYKNPEKARKAVLRLQRYARRM